jgi:hypothetical protein
MQQRNRTNEDESLVCNAMRSFGNNNEDDLFQFLQTFIDNKSGKTAESFIKGIFGRERFCMNFQDRIIELLRKKTKSIFLFFDQF